ncbi:hypothetical protein F4782DRAFT_528893 [Xylaria castorea]|nr:hypothetical protein F4782DRAFT_528893 [Xylaria castorea]
MPRAAVCYQCLDAMSKWRGPTSDQGAKPSYEDTKTSKKCWRCKGSNRRCDLATGVLKAHGRKLARVLAEATERDDTVKAAQLAVRRALQGKKEAAKLIDRALAAESKVIIAEVKCLAREYIDRLPERKALTAEKYTVVAEAEDLADKDPAAAIAKLASFARSLEMRFLKPSASDN